MLNNPTISADTDVLAVNLEELKIVTRNKSADDEELTPIIKAATVRMEDDLGRSFINKTWTWYLDTFLPSRDPLDDFWYHSTIAPRDAIRRGGVTIQVPRPPLVSITTIKYTDQSGVLQTVDSGDYQVDSHNHPGRIAPSASAVSWPSDVGYLDYLNAVEIIYVAGYGAEDANVPYPIKHAIAMLTGHYWENREASIMGMSLAEVNPGAWDMVASYRIWKF